MVEHLVLGAGMAGLGAAHRFRDAGHDALLVDRRDHLGGHASTKVADGFVFDEGPHVSFTRDERLQALFADGVDGRYETLKTRVDNHWRGHWIKHPAPCNLHGLPTDLVVDIVRDFVAARDADPSQATHYADWLIATYGRTFAETFPMVYGKKYHTADARDMTTDWLGPRLYRPSLDEVLRGALEPETPDVHYVDHFRYPTDGGFVAFLRKLAAASTIELEREVVSIDPRQRSVRFAGGRSIDYRHLISSLPLPELIARIEGTPREVVEAAGRLACTVCVLVDLGVDREDVGTAHWTYVYDEDIVFTRLSAPHRFSPNTVPDGASSLQAELYFSDKYRPLTVEPASLLEPTVRDLRRLGLLRDDDRLLHRDVRVVQYANIIFDHDRQPALDLVFGYLDELGIATCGRYGRWGYQWTDESFVSGENAARAVLDRG
ncbi:MAG: FAD-dependent oxidoreductase [Acidobacteriota bacterium]